VVITVGIGAKSTLENTLFIIQLGQIAQTFSKTGNVWKDESIFHGL